MQNILALYSVQFVNYLLPLVTIPFLTRVLRAEGWGLFAFFQSFSLYATTFADYSFTMAATRDVSRCRADSSTLSELLAGVIGAKIILSSGVVILCLVAQSFISSFRAHPLIFWMGICWALTLSFNLLWYFQGLEKMRTAAALDLIAKGAATASIFVFIRSAQHIWLIFLFYSIANLLSMLFAAFLAYRKVPFRWPTLALAWRSLQSGWQLFIARVWVNLYTIGNSFILGLLAAPATVGYFAGAERISKAAASLCNPVTQALFPRLSLIVETEPKKALALIGKSFTWLIIFSACVSLSLFLTASVLTRYVLGTGYESSLIVLRVMSPLPLIIALNNVLCNQWMLVLRMDRQYKVIVIMAAVLNITLAVLLVPRWGALGMAYAVVCAEFIVLVSVYMTLMIYRVHPFHHSDRILQSSSSDNRHED